MMTTDLAAIGTHDQALARLQDRADLIRQTVAPVETFVRSVHRLADTDARDSCSSLHGYSRFRRAGGFSRSSGRNDTPARSRATDASRRASSCRCSWTRNGDSPFASFRRR